MVWSNVVKGWWFWCGWLAILSGSVASCSAQSSEPMASHSEPDSGRAESGGGSRPSGTKPSGGSTARDGGSPSGGAARDASEPGPGSEPEPVPRTEPDVVEPEAVEPEAAEPEAVEPEAMEPEPEAVEPEPVEPEPTTDVAFPGAEPPADWTCSLAAYQDSLCHCGCGVQDLACESASDLGECESCNTAGSCNPFGCPGRIDPTATQHCAAPAEGWACAPFHYEDGVTCHCGCGAPDPDCASASVDACDSCSATGSCTRAGCPGSIAPDDNAVCAIPEGWSCEPVQYGDGVCTCGCGALDADCASRSLDHCAECNTGCSLEHCPGPIDPDDNTICSGVPGSWECERRFYGDGELCNCGCGAFDPDCESLDVSACDRCDFMGSCSGLPCPGIIDPDDNARCEAPPLPPGWTCDSSSWGDTHCDCGCGAVDVDCRDAELATCEFCWSCGNNCSARVNPDDTTECLPLPEGWTCEVHSYFDGFSCECGCGVVDPDCPSASSQHCTWCGYYASCSQESDCSDILPDDNAHCVGEAPSAWTCEPRYYGDDACDCGCGLPDPACTDATAAACDFCNSPGSCSPERCPGTIASENNAICAE